MKLKKSTGLLYLPTELLSIINARFETGKLNQVGLSDQLSQSPKLPRRQLPLMHFDPLLVRHDAANINHLLQVPVVRNLSVPGRKVFGESGPVSEDNPRHVSGGSWCLE